MDKEHYFIIKYLSSSFALMLNGSNMKDSLNRDRQQDMEIFIYQMGLWLLVDGKTERLFIVQR